ELKPFYQNPENKRPYPLLLRLLRTELATAIQKTVFDFVRIQTSHEPTHFQALGRQGVVQAVWKIDKQLVEISTQFRFLMLVTPVNADKAWLEFKEKNYEETPSFHYRLMPVDPELLKRKLFNIPVEKVEDPTLAYLFRDKRHELDKMITMLADRETPDFLYSSLQLFGGVDESLLKIAEGLLAAIPAPDQNAEEEVMPVKEFAALAQSELDFLRKQNKIVDAKVEIRPDVVSLMVSKGQFLIGNEAYIPRHRAEALIQHEVGTHVLTYYNGKAQPLQQLYAGVPGYEELQEGLAVLSEYLVGVLDHRRMRVLAARVVEVDKLIKGCTFLENFWMLHEKYHFHSEDAYDIAMRVHRGGGLTKDA
ncbi:MAG: flavohemoglobin expression-modulating QEGLA motif protein, partial [Hymenobacteraceae bacterium]|nr:flavohemoglobin expression-modulating QEGLA motif protein [Hymenobacteraceae bacterium]